MSTILPSHYSSSNNTAQSDLPGSVVAQAGGRSSNAPQEEHKPLSANNNNNNNEASNATTKTPLVIGLVLLAVVAIGGVTVWRRSSAGSSFGGGGPSATTQTTIAQVLEGVSMPAAREWMLTEDRYSARNTLSASRIRQRYTIAAVMVASNTQPNRDASECDWEGVECEDDDVVWRLERSGGASTSTTTAAAGQQHLPDELATFLPQIRELLLTQMQFSGTIPTPAATTTGWQQLTWLELSRNALTGTVPPELWTLPNLKFLYLDENNLTGRLERLEDSTTTDTASSVVAVSSLRQVHIFANRLTGPLPTWLGELYQLEHWIAYSNQLTGPALPEGAAPPPQLTYYDMSSNQLSGRIPPLLWSTTAATSSDTNDAAATPPPLETIYLEHNRLTGPLPPSSQRIPTLQTVYLQNNTLTGTIPNNFATNWMDMRGLRLGTNALEGTIPTSLWSHPTLERLDVSENQLEGTLPSSPRSTSLNDVQLQNNRFSGLVPPDFGTTWTQLQELRLDGNPDLTGTLGPSESNNNNECAEVWPHVLTLAADCRSLLVTDEPTITCECCTFCA